MDVVERARQALEAARADARDAIDTLEVLIRAEGDEYDGDAVAVAETRCDQCDAAVAEAGAGLARAERVAAARESNPEPEVEDEPEQRDVDVRVTRNESVYRPDGDRSFFRDVLNGNLGDYTARETIERHRREMADRVGAETRDTTAAAGGAGVIPPLYLSELMTDRPVGGRPLVDALPTFPLPSDGHTITIPKPITGTNVEPEAEAGTVTEQDPDIDPLSVGIKLLAGQVDYSRKLFDRSQPGFDQWVMRDLRAAYDEEVDEQCLAGDGTGENHLGLRAVPSINTVAYTDASPSAPEAHPKVYDAIQKIASNLKRGQATHIVMHPRRSAWFAAALSSTFPLFQQGQLVQAVGSQDAGMLTNPWGLNIITNPNVATNYGAGTNEDEILVVSMPELAFAEGPVMTRVYEEVLSGTLQIRSQLFAYSAFVSARRQEAITAIQGTGLVTPTF